MMSTILINLALGILAFGGGFALRRWVDRRRRQRVTEDEAFSDPGVSVEVDCRACGQFNRVRAHRLRDHPKCGRCKARLMPGKRVVL
jgi:Zn finger protein HypA/HybF involved in hydrogenase expression